MSDQNTRVRRLCHKQTTMLYKRRVNMLAHSSASFIQGSEWHHMTIQRKGDTEVDIASQVFCSDTHKCCDRSVRSE